MHVMAADKPPRYYRVRKGRAFWEPGEFGVSYDLPGSQPLGDDGADAKSAALKWNERLDAARKAKREGSAKPSRYPALSFGAFYEQFQRSEAWAQMEPRTREDYERAWPHIEKRFGDRPFRAITAGDSESFHVEIHPAHTNRRDPKGARKLPWNTAHRVLKVWRALLNALVAYDLRTTAPVGKVTNPAPPGRDAVWVHDEVQKLLTAADELNLHGIGVAIAIAWDAMLAPVDAFALPAGGFLGSAEEVRTQRRKTNRKVFGALTPATVAKVESYLARLAAAGVTLAADEPLVRDSRLRPYEGPHAKKYFERDFRAVRERAFPGDRRQFLDLRRSAITEARLGGATLDDLGASAANNLGADQALQSTYVMAASKTVLAARAAGRTKMADKFRKSEN